MTPHPQEDRGPAVLRGAAPDEVAARLRRYDAARLHTDPVPGPLDGRRGLRELERLHAHDAEAAALGARSLPPCGRSV